MRREKISFTENLVRKKKKEKTFVLKVKIKKTLKKRRILNLIAGKRIDLIDSEKRKEKRFNKFKERNRKKYWLCGKSGHFCAECPSVVSEKREN